MFQVPLGEMNLPVIAFAIGVSAFTAIAFGLMPAFTATRNAPMNTLRAGPATSSMSRARRWTLGTLVSAQLALTLVMLVAAGLMLQSFHWLRYRDLGFRSSGVLVAGISLDRARYLGAARQKAFFDNLLARASTLPGVENAALAAGAPLLSVYHLVPTRGLRRPEVFENLPLPVTGLFLNPRMDLAA